MAALPDRFPLDAMKSQLLSLFLLSVPLVMDVLSSDSTPRPVEACDSAAPVERDASPAPSKPKPEKPAPKTERARPADRSDQTDKSAAKPATKTPAGRDYWFM